MKNILAFLITLIAFTSLAQTNTEIYLFDILKKGNKQTLFNKKNISNNNGYDNQPYIIEDSVVLFSSTRNNQTDIAAYNIQQTKLNWITNTKTGSEYSPVRIPDTNDISAIRLDKDGKQLLYRYKYTTGDSKVLLPNLKVGYHTWYTKDIVISSVLEKNGLSLVVSNLKNNTNDTIQKQVGRSLHKIPNSNLISYISKENEVWEIKSLDPITKSTKTIIHTIPKVEDMCWLPNGTILMGKENRIFKFTPKTDSRWSTFYTFMDNEIGNISRMATNSNGNKLTVVSEVSPEHIVQEQVEAYNSRDINAFMATYTEEVSIYTFPNTLRYENKEAMRPYYEKKFKEEVDLNCKIKQRIVYQNKVIDEEYVTYKNKNVKVAPIYEIENGKIAKVTFIKPQENDNDSIEKNAEKIVQQQLDRYNNRDINGFMNTYSKDVKVYDFPNKLLYEGQEKMKKEYSDFFKNTTDLHCEIKNRIVMGNTVIDKEFLTINGKNYSAIAIYEIENNKITKVTFIR
ncbi:nuclear transport factor 2 family protein [Aquimarina muelleri]|uniref:SnoaL-like domain-containing protein n=1 Tax=Aquimarina muelleri TaxID=279356 RepID=A0A918JV58_9FLAO|nr:nuclear transport factor 2 family protein [Aquimarina muelleri]MCX2763601.1 nuclear transport factor 2 family protein [Aquimarina muelleri]GGX14699.1 hypothetical protein GCM10007384_15380 [Aquimarina muelleri]